MTQMLPEDHHPQATAEGHMATMSDDEFFAAIRVPELFDEDGQSIDHTEGVVDER